MKTGVKDMGGAQSKDKTSNKAEGNVNTFRAKQPEQVLKMEASQGEGGILRMKPGGYQQHNNKEEIMGDKD